MKNVTETIKVSANHSNRTFTIRKTYTDGSKVKYRTIPLSQDEFDRCDNNSENDWKQFLKSDDYYIV